MIRSILRHLRVSGKYTLLNVVGLILGLTLTVLIVMLLVYEISFDKFHSHKNEILCIIQHDLKDGSYNAHTPYPLPQTLKNDFPEVKAVAGFNRILNTENEIRYQDLSYYGFTGASVDEDVLSIFDFKLLLGNRKVVLDTPDKIIISQKTSQRIFGKENPVGMTLELQGFPFRIAGVFATLPENSALDFDILFSSKINPVLWSDAPKAWWASGLYTFVLLNEGYSREKFEAHLKQIPDLYYPDFLKGRSTYTTESFKRLHYDNTIIEGMTDPVSPEYLLILGIIALLTLLIAVINYISLSTARASRQSTEAGIRRISGASRWNIVGLHLGQAAIMVGIALLFVVPLCWICLPLFESYTNKPVSSQFGNPVVWAGFIAISVLVIFVSGLIPGVLFAKVRPLQTIRTKGFVPRGSGKFQSLFIVFQFGLSLILIISQLFVYKQIRAMKNADLGFEPENLTAIALYSVDEDFAKKYEKALLYKKEAEKYGAAYGFGEGCITENVPGFYFQNSFTVIPTPSAIDELLVVSSAVDENYLTTYDIDLMQGRFFSHDRETDKESFVINETAMKKLGWDDLENKYLKLSHEGKEQPVIGVIQDITATSLKFPVRPMIFRFGQHNNFPAYLTFRIDPAEKSSALAFLQRSWEDMFPEIPFDYIEVKETYFKNYESEQEFAQIITIFSVISIFLSALGLFGMISYMAERRTKEIGIRKVNGAKITEIIALLNKGLLKWIVVAFILSAPIAYYAVSRWLENFAYKTSLSWYIFAAAGLLTLGITLLAVSWQSWWAATRNPVEALRYE